MKLLFTGTASGYPVIDRRCTSLLVQRGERAMLFDAGEGAAAGLLAKSVDLDSIESVWISHTHADHISGLPMLLQGMHLAGRTAPLTLNVPPGREQWFRQWLNGMFMFEEKWSHEIVILACVEEGQAWGEAQVLPMRNRHLEKVKTLAADHAIAADAFSFIIDAPEGRVLVSSDIVSLDDIQPAAARVSTLVVDSTHVDLEQVHLLAQQAANMHVICTHIPPELEDRLDVLRERSSADFGGRILYAHDGMEYTVENAA